MDRLTATRALVEAMTDQERVTLAFHLLNCDWAATSDRVSDLFSGAFNALDHACFAAEFELIEPRSCERSTWGMAA